MECWSPKCLCLRLQGTGPFQACQPLELSCSSGWLWMLITAAAQLSLSLSTEKKKKAIRSHHEARRWFQMRSSTRSESSFLFVTRHTDKVTYIQSGWRTLKVTSDTGVFVVEIARGKTFLSDHMWRRSPIKWGHQLTEEPGTLQQEN